MIYRLKDKKNSKINIVATLEQILEFLNYPSDYNFVQAKYKLQEDTEYQNEYSSCYIEESRIHVAIRETGEFVADACDILQAMKLIETFESEDDSVEDYGPGYYDIVDDNHVSLLI